MQKQNKTILVVFGVTLLLGVAPVVAATPIFCGMTITEPGQYILTSDLFCGALGVQVAANHVNINMQGNTLNGSGDPPGLPGVGTGIITSDGTSCVAVTDLHINNGTVTGFGVGIHLCESINAHVNGMMLTGNTIGIRLFNSNGNRINDNDISDNGSIETPSFGVSLVNSNNNRFEGNLVALNSSISGLPTACGGFNLEGSDNNRITDNTISENGTVNGGFGVRIAASSTNNRLRGNTVNGNHVLGIIVVAANNRIQGNTVNNNQLFGIRLVGPGINNRVQSNTALGNAAFDLSDTHFPNCDNNTWKSNTFGSSNQACIQ